MLDEERKNLENLKTSNNANRNDIGQAETNILKLQEQLRQMHGEVSKSIKSKCVTRCSLMTHCWFSQKIKRNAYYKVNIFIVNM